MLPVQKNYARILPEYTWQIFVRHGKEKKKEKKTADQPSIATSAFGEILAVAILYKQIYCNKN